MNHKLHKQTVYVYYQVIFMYEIQQPNATKADKNAV